MTDRTRWKTLLSASLLLLARLAVSEDFQKALGGRYLVALEYVKTRGDSWCRQLESLGADPRTLVPVIFPELLKYSLFRNEVESLGLAVLYVTGGMERGGFSIGRFQMKPSFIEALEARLAAVPHLPGPLEGIIDFQGKADENARRALRLDRLREEKWQVLYLAGFSFVANSRFDLESLSDEESVRFLSAAYNRGFWFSPEEICTAETWRLFPRGSAGPPGPFRYSDIAVDFYRTYWSSMYNRMSDPQPLAR